MDDIAYGIKQPAVIDFKIGKITHDPEASIEKRSKDMAKYPDSEITGFQIVGMRVYDNKSSNFDHFDKVFCRSLDHKNIIHGTTY
jgi:1D-myo-inositol-tetrakisphosphate 5-kinase/inositol-polyphosphate multikinase